MAYTNIDDPSAYFQTASVWTGGSSTLAITNDGNSDLQPDWVWIKCTNASQPHALVDSSRGTSKYLQSASTATEVTDTGRLQSFDTDGFTLAGNSGPVNTAGGTYVGWQWKCNAGTTSSNTDGSKTATVQANTDAGFSIVTYSGSGSASTVGHGLADTPDVIIFKNRSAANVWAVYHQGLGNNLKLVLNATDAQDADGAFMNGTLPTSSVFTVGASVNTNGSGSNYVAYCFAEKQGYSKFGKYVGNGSTDGTFVYTGFKPAWIMCRRIDGGGNSWDMHDSARDPFNPSGRTLYADTNGGELTGNNVDLLSNGFKQRDTSANRNGSGNTYIYMAFAENPFTTSTGIPTTAR
jgi:hypothetical protein